MPQQGNDAVKLIFAITVRGKGRKWISEMNANQIYFNLQFSGRGTASSDMMDILGLESRDKDLVLSFGAESVVDGLAARMSEGMRSTTMNGLMMILSVSAINNIIAVLANRGLENSEQKGALPVKSAFDYSLILITVNQGYSDAVMQTAKKVGATGGTVIRARHADTAKGEQFYGITLQAEKEIVAIMAPGSTRDAIMEAVNAECGMRTKAQAIICAIPVDRAFKI